MCGLSSISLALYLDECIFILFVLLFYRIIFHDLPQYSTLHTHYILFESQQQYTDNVKQLRMRILLESMCSSNIDIIWHDLRYANLIKSWLYNVKHSYLIVTHIHLSKSSLDCTVKLATASYRPCTWHHDTMTVTAK
jgi:hypothetical protein